MNKVGDNMTDLELRHYGVKGMRWGVRKDKDGIRIGTNLTPSLELARKHYNRGLFHDKPAKRQNAKMKKKVLKFINDYLEKYETASSKAEVKKVSDAKKKLNELEEQIDKITNEKYKGMDYEDIVAKDKHYKELNDEWNKLHDYLYFHQYSNRMREYKKDLENKYYNYYEPNGRIVVNTNLVVNPKNKEKGRLYIERVLRAKPYGDSLIDEYRL